MLTPAQKTALKTDIAANVATIPTGQPWTNSFAGVAINSIPLSNEGNTTIAGWYSQVASPNFFVWRSSINRSDVYHSLSLDGTIWDWTTYKAQQIPEQNAWTQMFMGDAAPISNLNFREGVFRIFSGAGGAGQRAHIFAMGRRLATRIEKLLAAAPGIAGGITPSVSNGNTLASALGLAANPGVMGFEGAISSDDVESSRNS